jgi:aldehyde:ferredoxin oxidoreductase
MHRGTRKIIRVNLSAGAVRDQVLDAKMARDYIAGRGFGIQNLLAELDRGQFGLWCNQTRKALTPDVQGEIDVVGIDFETKSIYVCEVAIHLFIG